MTRISFALDEKYEFVFIADVICRQVDIFIKNEDERILAQVAIMFDSKEQMHEKLREMAWHKDIEERFHNFGNYIAIDYFDGRLALHLTNGTGPITIPCHINKLQAELRKLYPKEEENKMPELQVGDAVNIFGTRSTVIDSNEKSVRVAYRSSICQWEDKTDIKKIYRNGELIWEKK